MIQKSDGKIGSKEFFVLVAYSIALEATDMTPTFLFKDGKTATWMIPIFSGIVLTIPLLILLSIIKKFKNKGLIDVVYAITGKYAGFIINMVLFIIILAALILNSRTYVDIIEVMFFPRTPRYAIYIILIGSSYFVANRGLEALGRTAWIFYPYLIGAFILVIILASQDINMKFLYPLWGPGIKEIIKSAIENSSTVVDVFLFTVLFPYARSYKEFKAPVLWGLGVSIFKLSLLFAFYITVYDYPSAEEVAFPFQQMIMLASVGRFLTNIESLFFLFWVIASIVRFAIYLYLTAAIFGYTLGLKEFEPLLLPFGALTIMLGLIPKNYIEEVFIYRQNFLLKDTWVIFVLLPPILWLTLKLRSEKVK